MVLARLGCVWFPRRVDLRSTVLVVAASAASGAVAYKATESLQPEPTPATSPADGKEPGEGEAKPASEEGAEKPAAKADEPENLVLNLQPGGFVQQGSKVTLTFSADKLVKGGDAVEGLAIDDLVVLEDGEEASPAEGWRRFTSNFRGVRVNHRLLLDLSGSMATEKQLSALARAGNRYIEKVLAAKDSGDHFFAIDGFDGGPVVPIQSYTQDPTVLGQALANPCGTTLCKDPSTNLYGALSREIATFEAEAEAGDAPVSERAIVLFTDGIDQAGVATLKQTAAKNSETAVHVYTITVGSEADQERSAKLGKAGNAVAPEAGDIAKAAESIAERTPALAKHFYRFEYCTPKRGGKHELTLKIRHKVDDKLVLKGSLAQAFELTNTRFECDLPKPRL
jgi:hypothetical protein